MQTYQDILFQVQTETEQIFFRVPDSYKSEFSNGDSEDPFLEFLPWPIKVSSIIFGDGTEQSTAGGGGGGQNQTPWLSDIDAAGYSLSNITNIHGAISAESPNDFIITSAFNVTLFPPAGWFVNVWGRLNVTGYANFAGEFVNVTGGLFVGGAQVLLSNLPTSPDGLQPTQVWNNGGVLNIGPGGGGGSQTPWLSDIDADGFSLNDLGPIEFSNGSTIYAQSLDTALTLTATGGIWMQPGAGWAVRFAGRVTSENLFTVTNGNLVLQNLPTSPDGLFTGQVWNNGGVLNIA